jgi:ABC-2 type transport system permease protein
VNAPATLTWFARHEVRLAWRDWLSMMTAGRSGRELPLAIALTVIVVVMHLIALSMVGGHAAAASVADLSTLVTVTGSAFLTFALMLSQALESMTRAIYSRSDLDLILSSPVAVRRVLSVRILTIAASIALMALLLSAPFINVLVARGGMRWLGGYGVVLAMALAAVALAVALTDLMFRALGPRRTRLVAQIVAAVIGATFIIGLQVAAILSLGTMSRVAMLESTTMLEWAPGADSLLWLPARAMLGDTGALITVMACGIALLGASILLFSARFAGHAVAAAGVAHAVAPQARVRRGFRSVSAARALRHKEWTLLKRDPWLLSQTLMQLLYLLPPALMLWKSFAEGTDGFIVVVPVLVMAAGQLSGGLAWLAISGEDAPELVATAPVARGLIMRAKVEAVMGAIALVFAPFVLLIALVSPFHALVSAAGIAAATGSATAVQFWFRTQAKRSHFRRRQTSSRVATFAEAFSSIAWAATAALATVGMWLALIMGAVALGLLATARAISPARTQAS